MKPWLAALTAAGLLLAPAAQAKPDPRVAAVQKQVAAVQKQLAALSAQLSILNGRIAKLEADSVKNAALAPCYYAFSQDSFRIVFQTLSQFAKAMTGNSVPAWDAIPRYDDRGACAAAGLSRP